MTAAGSLQSWEIINSQLEHNHMCQITNNVECDSGLNWIIGEKFSRENLV